MQLATALRRGPYNVNLLLAGYDSSSGPSAVPGTSAAESAAKMDADDAPTTSAAAVPAPTAGFPSLYWVDYLGTLQKVNFGAHGYAAYFVTATLDRLWKPDLSREEALELVAKCISVLKTRFLPHQPAFLCRIVDASGVSVHPIPELPKDAAGTA